MGTTSDLELDSLLSFGKDDWAVITPDGRFDASPGAMAMLYWRDGNEIVESDRVKQAFPCSWVTATNTDGLNQSNLLRNQTDQSGKVGKPQKVRNIKRYYSSCCDDLLRIVD